MAIEENINPLINGGIIDAAALVLNDGSVAYQTSNWAVDGKEVISTFQEKKPSIVIQGVKYSTIDITEDRLIATNVSGQGHVVGAVVGDKGILLAYVSGSGDPRSAYVELDKVARQIAKEL